MLHPDQARIRTFRVVPSLPEPLEPLLEIARNLWWTWSPDAIALFVRLDPELWSRYEHNPVKLLGYVSQDRLEQASRDESFLHEIYRVYSRLDQHCTRQSWFEATYPDAKEACIAYFSAEFGLTECFQIYSGGLGILAGDHLKSASELGLPLVGIGLLYQNGYFMQYLNADGWQQETYPDLDFANQPIDRVRDPKGNWLKTSVNLAGRDVVIGIWKCKIGRITLYLMDTNLPENHPADRHITRNLYSGDVEARIQQEIILGIGGIRTLTALGIRPTVCHINEGHAAFLALERIRMSIDENQVDFDVALEQTSASHVFTTHTPVPAGIDRFHPDLVRKYFQSYMDGLRLNMDDLLTLGREHVDSPEEFFSMAVLAIRTSRGRNGVSKLHGEVSRKMWRGVWPGVPENEVPINHVTNGTHTRSWLSADMIQLFNRYLGYRWQNDSADYSVWDRINEIPDEELWAVHSQRRRKLITWVRGKIKTQRKNYGETGEEIERATAALDPDALTIGFARRFATYKRATLLLRDRERLLRLLSDETRPIQLLVAGKSHPADTAGKELIRDLVHFARKHSRHNHADRIVFLENYDMNVARHMVTGCDVWLNTPRRGLEASGTSGMKAAVNGVINCSILDGWWDEAYEPDLGFAIGRREEYTNDEEADRIESANLYDIIEDHILPEFYDRDASGIPRRWVQRMKQCIRKLAPFFNTNRMVQEYAEEFYIEAHHRSQFLTANNLEEARGLAEHLRRYRELWHHVRVEEVHAETEKPLPVRTPLPVEAIVHLGELTPDEISVQAYTGHVGASGELEDGTAMTMMHVEDLGNGRHRFTGELSADHSGRRGLAVRVVPNDPRMATPFLAGKITWDEPEHGMGATNPSPIVQPVPSKS